MEFVAIDVETANPDLSSICQIGLARFCDGEVVEEWSSLIDPEDEFDDMNVSIHGKTRQAVIGAPRYPDVRSILDRWGDGAMVVSHTTFDQTSIHRAATKYDIEPPNFRWLDSARVARRTWESIAKKGYGLSNICKMLGYSYAAHNALEDAKAAGFVLSEAIKISGVKLEEWPDRVRQSRSGSTPLRSLSGDPDGALNGEVIVFTGALSRPRREIAQETANLGADIPTSVTKKTTMVVVGDQDIRRLAGHDKSSKHRKAEELIAAGNEIRILQESDFMELIKMAQQ